MKLVERYLYEDIEGAVPVPDADGLWSGQMKGVGRSYRIADIIGDDTVRFYDRLTLCREETSCKRKM